MEDEDDGMRPCCRFVGLMLAALMGCSGATKQNLLDEDAAASGTRKSSAQTTASFVCTPTHTPDPSPLRRLTRTQYVNTVEALVEGTRLPEAEVAAVLHALRPDLERFPRDRHVGPPRERHGGFTQLDQSVQQGHIDVSYEVAVALGRLLTASQQRMTALLGPCGTDHDSSNDDLCLTAFITTFGAATHRRPLTDSEVGFYRDRRGTRPVEPAVIAEVITLMMTSPQFLYHVEAPFDPAAAGTTPVGPWSLAARLSYHFWQAPPDEELAAAAASRELLTPAGYSRAVERLFADPRTDATIRDFFHQWLRLDDVKALNTRVGTPVFDAFAGDARPSADLHHEMQTEILDLVTWVVRSGGTVRDVLTSRKSFARRPDLVALYGPDQARWDGSQTPPDFAEPERVGLVTRAAFLASPSGNTRPIMKGFHVRNALLCESVPPPPDNAAATAIELSADMTTREQVEQLTQQPGSACNGCHKTVLNPMGFATENFDALGRRRTHQRLFDTDGAPRGSKPVDTRGRVFLDRKTHEIDGAGSLVELLTRGGRFEQCFTRQYFRFAFNRPEDEVRDGCVLASLHEKALSGAPLAEVLKAIAFEPAFKQGRFR